MITPFECICHIQATLFVPRRLSCDFADAHRTLSCYTNENDDGQGGPRLCLSLLLLNLLPGTAIYQSVPTRRHDLPLSTMQHHTPLASHSSRLKIGPSTCDSSVSDAKRSWGSCSMSMDAATSPLLEAAEGVRSGRTSSEELVTQALQRLEETDGDVGAFLSVQGRAAVEAARAIDRKV